MKSLSIACAAALALAATGVAAQETYGLDSRHTHPSFEVTHFGMSAQRGMFNKVAGKATIDFAAKKGSVDVTIDMAAVLMGEPKLADHLRSEDFFDVAKFPTATFKSSSFRFDGDRLVGVDGDLTLKGMTRPVTLAVSNFSCAPHPMNKKPMCGGNASGTFKRSDFGVSKFIPAVSDEVKLTIPVEAFKE
jgi:polyisoprenoid-binding protein YceI